MSTLIEIATFLIRVFGSLYLCIILLRFLLQMARADFYNPISQFMVRITNPPLLPLRKIVPGLMGVDLASIILAIFLHYLAMQLILLVMGAGFPSPLLMLAWSLVGVTLNVISIYIFAGFVLFISSFIAPYSQNPALLLVRQLLQPLLAPIQRLIPPAGGLDFSLFFVGIGLYVLRIVIRSIGETINTPFGLLIGYA